MADWLRCLGGPMFEMRHDVRKAGNGQVINTGVVGGETTAKQHHRIMNSAARDDITRDIVVDWMEIDVEFVRGINWKCPSRG